MLIHWWWNLLKSKRTKMRSFKKAKCYSSTLQMSTVKPSWQWQPIRKSETAWWMNCKLRQEVGRLLISFLLHLLNVWSPMFHTITQLDLFFYRFSFKNTPCIFWSYLCICLHTSLWSVTYKNSYLYNTLLNLCMHLARSFKNVPNMLLYKVRKKCFQGWAHTL